MAGRPLGHGLEQRTAAANNRRMKPQFKETQIFDWENEPVGERPSEFTRSTGYSVLSGYQAIAAPIPNRRRSHSRFGFKSWTLFAVIMLTVCAYAMLNLAPMLRT